VFSILDPARRREVSDPVEKTDRLGAVSKPHLRTHISKYPNSLFYEADKAACDFAASIAAAYRMTRKITSLDRKYKIPGLNHLLKHK
jgi:hypothetical protein